MVFMHTKMLQCLLLQTRIYSNIIHLYDSERSYILEMLGLRQSHADELIIIWHLLVAYNSLWN